MDAVYRFANGLGRFGLKALAIDTRWHGDEHVPLHGPVILAATHVSYPDFVFIQQAVTDRRRLVRFMCRHDVWKGPVLTWGMDQMRHIPVNREVPAHAYLRARSLLRARR
ncbi:MAG: 1-acyl-sn-glycerol-3-phosphate acyltransferase [Myxococcales bacterium]|nr:MAG: 1-acyl-sn-glycerol-3-phosphate acyltransferase [Myxococcales bacterium]